MKHLAIFIIAVSGFTYPKSNKELFDEFHIAYEQADFKKLESILADDFVALNANGIIQYRKADYIKFLKDWSKTFNTKWNVESVEEENGNIVSIEYDTNIYNDFFYEGKMRTKYIYTFSEGKITSIQWSALSDSRKWQEVYKNKFSRFLQWVHLNHPKKLHFCTSFDKKSAIKTKALLEAYTKKENAGR